MPLPPSLSEDILERAFRASNGELGIAPDDVMAFIDACHDDGVILLGWELWIIDHRTGVTLTPIPSFGQWTGIVPTRKSGSSVFGGSGDAQQIRGDIMMFDLHEVVDGRWIEHCRFNFTMHA